MTRERRRSAAALAYDAKNGDAAPRVIAKGYGLVADMIVQRAQEAGLYVHTAPQMVSLLMQVDLDSRIPPELYKAVAELLAWLYQLESGAHDAVLHPVADVPEQEHDGGTPHGEPDAGADLSPSAPRSR